MIVKKEVEIGGKIFSIETGRYARQANGAVMVRYADTMVLVTAVASAEAKENQDFFPLQVEYREKTSAAGKFPGGFIKREGRPTEKEILSSRLIDRPIRPLFPENFMNETQVIAFVVSYDGENDADVLAAIGASAALTISDVPFDGPIAEVRIGRIEGQLIVNPTHSQIEQGDLELVVAGTSDSIIMVEGESKEVSEAMLAQMAKKHGALVVVDAAQIVAHQPVDMSLWSSVDFVAFSSHKICGPTGAGVLVGRKSILNEMPPYQFGGDMIRMVRDENSDWNELPWKFEAGTPNFVGMIGMGEAIDYLNEIGMAEVEAYEKLLTKVAIHKLKTVPGLRIIGPEGAEKRGSVLSFTLTGVHPHDFSTYLDAKGIAIRAGHHCAQPLMNKCGLVATGRASFAFYNTTEEIEFLVEELTAAARFFAKGVTDGVH